MWTDALPRKDLPLKPAGENLSVEARLIEISE